MDEEERDRRGRFGLEEEVVGGRRVVELVVELVEGIVADLGGAA